MGAVEKTNPSYSVAEYLALDRLGQEKYEFIEGELRLMSGGSARHSLITANLTRQFAQALDPTGCLVFSSDLKIQAKHQSNYYYPDLSIVCESPEFLDEKEDVLTNPLLIAEVLFPSTEAYDRGEKFMRYRQIPSLKAYLLISQHIPMIEVYQKNEEGKWVLQECHGLDSSFSIEFLSTQIGLERVYAKVGL